MFSLLLMLLPTAVSIVFFFKFLTMEHTHRSHHLMTLLSAASALFFFADANYYSAYEDYRALVICDVISAYAAPMLPALVMLMLRSIIYEKYVKWYTYIVIFVLPYSLGAMTFTQYWLMGMDDSVAYLRLLTEMHPSADMLLSDLSSETSKHFIITIVLYYLICGVLCFLTLWQIGYYMYKTKFRCSEIPNYLFRSGEIEPLHLQGILFVCIFTVLSLRLLIFRHYILAHQWIAILFALVLGALAWMVFYVGARVNCPTLSLRHKDVQAGSDTGYSLDNSEDISADSGHGISKVSYVDMAEEECDCEVLMRSIRNKMTENRDYLSPTLTIEEFAASLCSNKTYISRCVNKHMHISFRDYVNNLRIEYAKEKMLSHPELVQDEIASMSGFADASTFNRKFRQVVGMTPRQWLLGQES